MEKGLCAIDEQITEFLRVGSKGRQVELLQRHINHILAAVYDRAAGPVDGIFGPLTKLGVQRLQTVLRDSLNMDLGPAGVDGIVGSFTQAAINNSCSS